MENQDISLHTHCVRAWVHEITKFFQIVGEKFYKFISKTSIHVFANVHKVIDDHMRSIYILLASVSCYVHLEKRFGVTRHCAKYIQNCEHTNKLSVLLRAEKYGEYFPSNDQNSVVQFTLLNLHVMVTNSGEYVPQINFCPLITLCFWRTMRSINFLL